MSRLAVIGIGNPMRGDDGIGPAVIEAMRDAVPPGVALLTLSGEATGLVDALAALDAAIVIDCAAGLDPEGRDAEGRDPRGTVSRFTLPGDRLPPETAATSSHAGGLQLALRLLTALGRMPRRVTVFTVAGSRFDVGVPMSAALEAAVSQLARAAQDEIASLTEIASDA